MKWCGPPSSKHTSTLLCRLLKTPIIGLEKWGTLNQVKTVDIRSYLCDDILKKVDLASMMNSLEVRPPIIDLKVHELLQKMPQSMLVDPRGDKFTGKRILKLMLQKNLTRSFYIGVRLGLGFPLMNGLDKKTLYIVKLKERCCPQTLR